MMEVRNIFHPLNLMNECAPPVPREVQKITFNVKKGNEK